MSETLPAPQPREALPSQENPTSSHFAALKARLLMSGKIPESLNPDKKDFTQVNREDLGQVNYQAIEHSSYEQRVAYWGDGDPEVQKREWVNNTVNTFKQGEDFFKGDGDRWTIIFKSLGTDATNFTPEQAVLLYEKYLSGDKHARSKKLEQFVKDITSSIGFNLENSTDIEAVEWIGHIFGEKVDKEAIDKNLREVGAHEVIKHCAVAEKQFKEEPDQVVNEANEGLRINNPNPDEERIMRFVWKGTQAINQPADQGKSVSEPPTQPDDGQPYITQKTPEEPILPTPPVREQPGFGWSYFRPGDPRQFPQEASAGRLLNPSVIAEQLRKQSPERYIGYTIEQLAQAITAEQDQLQKKLVEQGLTPERLSSAATSAIKKYEDFVKSTYEVNIPDIENIRIQPITGKTVEYFGVGDGTFAFVDVGYPIIFLNMDTITTHARQLGIRTGNNWQQMSPQVLGNLMERLLNEIHPHEYTHLVGDLAFWRRSRTTPTGHVEITDVLPGKTGVKVAKPIKTEENGVTIFKYQERGRWLSEAITVELTNRWAKNMNAKLDIDAYHAEREVLNAMENLLGNEQGIGKEEAFKKIAKAYFSPDHFLHLVKELSGPRDAQGRYKRPHFLSLVYGLMEYENKKHKAHGGVRKYELALGYVNNQLNPTQKFEIINHIQDLELPQLVEEFLRSNIGSVPLRRAA